MSLIAKAVLISLLKYEIYLSSLLSDLKRLAHKVTNKKVLSKVRIYKKFSIKQSPSPLLNGCQKLIVNYNVLHTVPTKLEIICHTFIPCQKRIQNPVKHEPQKAPSTFNKVLDAPLLILSKVFKTLHASFEMTLSLREKQNFWNSFQSPCSLSGQNSANRNEISSHTPKYKKGMILLKVT